MDDAITSAYNIFEFASLDDLYIPVRNSARVKYTCYDVSEKFLFIGANSGSLYVFLRHPLQYLRVLSNKEGPLVFICVAPHDQYVAFATNKGIVILLEHNINNAARVGRSGTPTLPPRYLHVSREHQGAIITALTWNESGTILFIADDTGKITSVSVNAPKTTTLFKESAAMIAQLDSKPVQMEFASYKLLISTLKSCYLCDTVKEQYSQIGSKPSVIKLFNRAGEFGACFYNKSEHNQRPCIYAARPGSRLWKVEFDGSVLCTHQFKQALTQDPVPFVSVREDFFSVKTYTSSVPNSVNFPRLLIVGNCYLLTWVKNKLILMNPVSMMVLLSTIFAKDIQDIKVYSEMMYIWFVDGQFRSFQLLTVEDGISKLLSLSCWKLSALVCNFYKPTVISANSRKLLPKHFLETLSTHLIENDEKELKKAIESIVENLEESPVVEHTRGSLLSYHIESGIYVVNRPRGDPKQLTSHQECTSSGSSSAIHRKIDNVVMQPNESAKSTGSTIEKESTFLSTKPNEPFSTGNKHFINSQSSVEHSNSQTIKKSSSATDVQRYKEGNSGMSRDSSLDVFYYGYPAIPISMPFIGGAFWDVDSTSLAALSPGAALGGLRNSLTSKYKSGKESILGKIGVLEDHLKSIVIEDLPELLDVPHGINNTSSCQDINDLYDEALGTNISPILKIDLSALLRATKEASVVIHNSSKITRNSEHKQVLEGWVDALISTQELMYSTFYDQRSKAALTTGNTSQLNHSKTSINVHAEKLIQHSRKPQFDNQLWSPNNFRRRSWPNARCDNHMHQESAEIKLTNKSEPQKNICKSCTLDLEMASCGQNSDHMSSQTGPSLQFEDFLWWCDMRLLDKNPITNTKDVKEDHCLFCYPTNFIKDPWGMRMDEHKLVSRLATICFKTRTFGRIWKYSANFACFKNITNLEQPELASETHAPVKFSANNSEMENDDTVLDHARSIFVTQFFHLLDAKEIFQELHHDKQATFQTWSAILSGITKHAAKKRGEFKSFNALLSALSCQEQDFPLIIDKLLSERDSYSARDVLYVERLRQNKDSNLFLEYMDAIYEGRHSGTEILKGIVLASHNCQDMCKDPVVQLAWLSYLLQDGMKSSPMLINCVCGKPRPWAHLLHWKRTDLLLQILRQHPKNQETCLRLCETFGFWLGYLYLCHGLNRRQEGLAILVQLGDISLFSDHFNIALLPQTPDEWRIVLHLIAQKENKKNCCLFCTSILTKYSGNENVPKENALSFQSAAPYLFKLCGTYTSLKLIKEILEEFVHIKLPASFYRQCILSAMVKQQERNMDFKSIMFMNADVASCNKNYASPQIRSHLIKEVQNCQPDILESPTINRCPFREDFPCHWGINIDLSSLCHTCSLPLALPLASAHEGGIRMFPCGHGFHLQCIKRNTCPSC